MHVDYSTWVGRVTTVQWYMEAVEVYSRAENFHRKDELERHRAALADKLSAFEHFDLVDRFVLTLGAMCKAVAAVRNGVTARSVNATNACDGSEHCWCDDCEGWRRARRRAEVAEAEIKKHRAAAAQRDQRIADLEAALRLKSNYPTLSIVKHLVDAAEHLFSHHNCDATGWELWQSARDHGKSLLAEIAGKGAGG